MVSCVCWIWDKYVNVLFNIVGKFKKNQDIPQQKTENKMPLNKYKMVYFVIQNWHLSLV